MIDLTGNPASIDKSVPLEKLFSKDDIDDFQIECVMWKMTIKPGVRPVTPYLEGRIRMEEIEVLLVRVNSLPDTPGYRYLLSRIHAKILYPCIVFFEHKSKYKISAWKFIDGVNKNQNILKSSFVSAWIRDLPASDKTAQCAVSVQKILMNGKGNLKDLYEQLCHCISGCSPQYIGSRAHLIRILYALEGSQGKKLADRVDCTKKYEILNPNEKYRRKRYSSAFKYCYEYEDIWYALMIDEKAKKIIENRRYRDIEDLIYQIDSQYEEQKRQQMGW